MGPRRTAPRATPAPDRTRTRAGQGRHAAAPVRRPWRRRVLTAVLVVGTLVALAFALPTRTLLDNRTAIADAQSRLAVLDAANADAQAKVDSLRSGSELERLAREQYGYAKPGEEVYHVLPAPKDPVRVPDAWPFDALGSTLTR